MTLMELKEQLKGKYPAGSAKQLEKLERELWFADFDSQTALELGSRMVRLSRKYGEGIAVRIMRESDGMAVFQYVEDDRARRNLDFAMKKRNAVLKTGHCSLWAMVWKQTHGGPSSDVAAIAWIPGFSFATCRAFSKRKLAIDSHHALWYAV